MKTIQIGANPVFAKIFTNDDDACLCVSNTLSYFVDGYEHTDGYKSGGWDGRSTFFNWKDNTFPAGFVTFVEQELRGKGYNVQIVKKPLPDALGPEKPEIDSFGYTARYDYQLQTVEELLKRGAMIARVATGGGKSRIAKIAHARIGRSTLFITTRKALMYQMKKSFEESGYEVGVIGDGEWNPNADINVAMIQTLSMRLEKAEPYDDSAAAMRQRRLREKVKDFLENVDFIIGEEAHEAGGSGYTEVLKHCRNAHYRLALTATPFMREDAEANMRLMAAFGQIGIEISEKLLIEREILAKPIFKFKDVPTPEKLRKTMNWQRAVELGIVENINRNMDIAQEAKEASFYGLPVMILVQRKKHGKILRELCETEGLSVDFIFGETSNQKRQEKLDQLKNHDLNVLIGSTILDVGVDVPSIGMVILAGGGKAEVQLRQRIGRGLRSKSNMPNYCMVVDYEDKGNKHLRRHSRSREKIIRDTPGFSDGVLKPRQDFPYEKLGFEKSV